MLAGTLPPGGAEGLSYPVAATPKLDGIRALMVDGCLVSRQFKPIPNAWLRAALEAVLPDGADGEVVYGETFQDCTSAVMTRHAEALPGEFRFYWFDHASCDVIGRPYGERMEAIRKYTRAKAKQLKACAVKVIPLYPTALKDAGELLAFEEKCLASGHEGVILRKPDGKYKCGRSTLREGLMLKMKRFMDAEAVVVGWEELQHNHNKSTVDALGHTKRSSHKENKSAGNKLGALVVESAAFEGAFNVGTGFSDEERVALWKEREQLLGKIVKFKYFDVGVKEAPRHPVFLGFRSPEDM
jgi:DNA ligase-1